MYGSRKNSRSSRIPQLKWGMMRFMPRQWRHDKKIMNKKFQELLREFPDRFDDMDCRPGPSTYPAEDLDDVTPDHVKKAIADRANRPMERWSIERLQEVKEYLEDKDPATLTREDHYLVVEYLVHRYLPDDSTITEAQWQAKRAELRAKIGWNLDNPDAPKEPIKEDPEFAKWLDDLLNKQ